MFPLMLSLPVAAAMLPAEAPPEFPVCPVSGAPYKPGTGIFLTVRGHRYWVCHSTHAEALDKNPERYLDARGVPLLLLKSKGAKALDMGASCKGHMTQGKERP